MGLGLTEWGSRGRHCLSTTGVCLVFSFQNHNKEGCAELTCAFCFFNLEFVNVVLSGDQFFADVTKLK